MEVCLLLTIRHTIEYRYHAPVFFEPLTLRLRPRSDVFQRLIAFDLEVAPLPAGRSDCIDLEGNSSTSLWFEGMHNRFSIVATSRVETMCANPFGFIITAESASRIPVVYPEELANLIEPYLHRIDPCEEVDEWAATAIRQTNGQPVSFLCALAGQIAQEFSKVVRRTGAPLLPSVTVKERCGACRDLTLLFMDVCRSVGLASRFVSGYVEDCKSGVRGELHAWAEVFLPGGGWRGFDPTLGLAATDRHVAVAASPLPLGASPVDGTFRGDSAGSTMDYEVSVLRDDDESTVREP
jgi:transglutaminase-like putative cysteine protease